MDDNFEEQIAAVDEELEVLARELRTARRTVARVQARIRATQQRRAMLMSEADRRVFDWVIDHVVAEAASES